MNRKTRTTSISPAELGIFAARADARTQNSEPAVTSKTHRIIRNAAKFNTLSGAKLWGRNTVRRHLIILGDDGKFWSLEWREALHLAERGYELEDYE